MAERFGGFGVGQPSEAELAGMVRERERSPEHQGRLKAGKSESWRDTWRRKMIELGVPAHVAQGLAGGGERNLGIGLVDVAGPLPAAADAVGEWMRGNPAAAGMAALGVVPVGKGASKANKLQTSAEKLANKQSFNVYHGTNVPYYTNPLPSKALSGEGTAAFGQGHYVTEAEALGGKYAKEIAQGAGGDPTLHVQHVGVGRSGFMNWYKPYEEQPTVIREGLEAFFDANGLDPAKLAGLTGEQIYGIATKLKGSQGEASKVLNNFGIPGIKYPTSHTKEGKSDTSNYVIFDPQKVTGAGTKPVGQPGDFDWAQGAPPQGWGEQDPGVSTPGASTGPRGTPVAGAGKGYWEVTKPPPLETLKQQAPMESWAPEGPATMKPDQVFEQLKKLKESAPGPMPQVKGLPLPPLPKTDKEWNAYEEALYKKVTNGQLSMTEYEKLANEAFAGLTPAKEQYTLDALAPKVKDDLGPFVEDPPAKPDPWAEAAAELKSAKKGPSLFDYDKEAAKAWDDYVSGKIDIDTYDDMMEELNQKSYAAAKAAPEPKPAVVADPYGASPKLHEMYAEIQQASFSWDEIAKGAKGLFDNGGITSAEYSKLNKIIKDDMAGKYTAPGADKFGPSGDTLGGEEIEVAPGTWEPEPEVKTSTGGYTVGKGQPQLSNYETVSNKIWGMYDKGEIDYDQVDKLLKQAQAAYDKAGGPFDASLISLPTQAGAKPAPQDAELKSAFEFMVGQHPTQAGFKEAIADAFTKKAITQGEYDQLNQLGKEYDWDLGLFPKKAPLPPKGMKPVAQPPEDEVLMNTALQIGGSTPQDFIDKALDLYDSGDLTKATLAKLVKVAKAQEDSKSAWDIQAAFTGGKAQTFAPVPGKNPAFMVEGVNFEPYTGKGPEGIATDLMNAAGGDSQKAYQLLAKAPGIEKAEEFGISSYTYKDHLVDIEKALRRQMPSEKPEFPDPEVSFRDLDSMAPNERQRYKDDLFPESDLPQDADSRAAREREWREQGPDMDLYTGIGSRDAYRRDAIGFKDPSSKSREPGIFLTEHSQIAEAYAEPNSRAGGHTMKLRLRATNPREVEWTDYAQNPSYEGDTMERLIRETWGMGHDVLRVKNMRDIGWTGDQDQWIVRNPNQLRSTFAHFDPKHKKSRNLLRAAAPTMIGAGAIMAAKREKEKEDE
jgi:hypothetical protein